jgi:acetylornithine deacetylase
MPIAVDEQYVTDVLTRLVQIDSSNPALTPGAPGEAAIAAYLADEMAALGLDVSVDEVQPGRPNVVGRRAGSGQGRSLMLNGHVDTVGVEGMADPFSAAVRDGRLYGRGAYDMKGGVAAMLGAARALADADIVLAGDLVIAAVADEEHASRGTERVCQQIRCDGAIVTEPTDLAICRAHRGFIWFRVETTGRAAHGSRYQEGVDANLHMGRVLAALDELAGELIHREPHPLMGPPSLNASLLEGGSEISVYAARSVLQMEWRTIAGESVDSCTKEIQAILDRLADADPAFTGGVEAFFHRDPFDVSAEADVVQAVQSAARAVLGGEPEHVGQTFWTDAALLAGAGMETVIIGPTGHGLHSAEEWVDLDSVCKLTGILAGAAVSYCGTA